MELTRGWEHPKVLPTSGTGGPRGRARHAALGSRRLQARYGGLSTMGSLEGPLARPAREDGVGVKPRSPWSGSRSASSSPASHSSRWQTSRRALTSLGPRRRRSAWRQPSRSANWTTKATLIKPPPGPSTSRAAKWVSLPSDYTFTGADAGAKTFSVTFNVVGDPTVTATDTTDGTIFGTLGSDRCHRPAGSFTVDPIATRRTAGTQFTVTAPARWMRPTTPSTPTTVPTPRSAPRS